MATRVIYKHEITITDYQKIQTGANPTVLHFGEQNGKYYVWVEQDQIRAEPSDAITFIPLVIKGTGHTIREREVGAHLSTLQDSQGFVWHLYYGLK